MWGSCSAMFGHASQISFLTILAIMVLVLYTTGSCSDEALGPMDDPQISSIYKGECAKKNEFPFMVFLYFEPEIIIADQHLACGGSIISDRWIITAAHCLKNMMFDDVTVYIGLHDLMQPDEKGLSYHDASHLFQHPDYTEREDMNALHDIGLIKLRNPLNFKREHSHIKPIELAGKDDAESFPPGTACLLTGWGRMTPGVAKGKKKHHALQKLRTTIKSATECEKRLGGKSIEGGLCSTSSVGYALEGDSGGPLLCPKKGRDVLAGVFNSGEGLDGGVMLYTPISSYIDWIKDVTKLKLP